MQLSVPAIVSSAAEGVIRQTCTVFSKNSWRFRSRRSATVLRPFFGGAPLPEHSATVVTHRYAVRLCVCLNRQGVCLYRLSIAGCCFIFNTFPFAADAKASLAAAPVLLAAWLLPPLRTQIYFGVLLIVTIAYRIRPNLCYRTKTNPGIE